jgi:hypothetical protein
LAIDLKTDTAEPTQARWMKEIKRAQSYFQKWEQRGDKLLKLYKRQQDSSSGSNRKFAMLWANTEVLKPVVTARGPIPQVSRRFKDKDPVGRVASELLERCCSYEIERMDLWGTLQNVRDDLLLPGRGTVWARYEVDTGPQGISDERAQIDYVYWKDFLHNPARHWGEVWWVAKRVYLTAKEGKARFKDKWKGVGLDHSAEKQNQQSSDPTVGLDAKATVWEIWSKRDQKVYFIAQGCDHVLEEADPFLSLDNFFPCPKPVWATLTTDSLIPTPDYAYYQDQAEEIDDLTARIAHLTDQLQLKGFYPAGKGEISQAIEAAMSPNNKNVLIPIESWAALSDKGVDGVVVWMPLKDVVEALRGCIELRNQLIQDVYQITGISDVVRGQTDPDETLGAQQLKSQWGSIRVEDRQNQFAAFARDTLKLVCEIIAERFEPQRMISMANMMPEQPAQQTAPPVAPAPPGGMPSPGGAPPQPPQPDPAILEYQKKVSELQAAAQLLRDEKVRCFRIDIETDSTIAPDEDAEKQRRTEFIGAVGTFLKDAMPIVAQAPQLLPMAKEMFLFTVRGYRAGRMMEDVIERSVDALEKAMEQSAQAGPPPDPKVALEAKKWEEAEKPKTLAEAQKIIAETKLAETQATLEPMKMQAEQERGQQEMGMKQQQFERDGQHKEREFGHKEREFGMKEQEHAASREDASHTKQMDYAKVGLDQMASQREDQNSQVQNEQTMIDKVTEMAQAIRDMGEQIIKAQMLEREVTTPDGRKYTSKSRAAS